LRSPSPNGRGYRHAAGVAKLADAPDLGSGAARHVGSIPIARTLKGFLREAFFMHRATSAAQSAFILAYKPNSGMKLGEWIREAKNGSSAAQKCLFDEMANPMLVTCYRYVKNQQDAEELLLNGFYKFFRNIAVFTYETDAALYSYVKKIMVNECLMFLRKKKVFTIVTDTAAADIALEESALNDLSAQEILALVVQLPVGYRTVFNLHAIEGYEHAEIAELLGINPGTSKSQLSKARTLLQKMITQKGIDYVKQSAR
jgi:RNA polymerase sigma factor (sigma-70 family)